MLELTANTEEGARLVELAETLAAEFAATAPQHDREATFPHDSVDALKRAGYFTAPIPAEYGGLGVTSVHDVVVASSRLARGDASVAIGVNMHLVILLNIVRRWQAAVRADDLRRVNAFGLSLHAIARDGVIMASAVSEHGQDLTRPATKATRTDTGWRIDGRKAFCTGSPAATVLNTAVTFTDDDGVERYGFVGIAADAPGVEIHGDWDALGMRASGSHSVSFTRRRGAARRAARQLRRRRLRRVHGAHPDRRPVPRVGVARDRGGGGVGRGDRAGQARASPMRGRGCWSPRTRSSSARAARSLSRAAMLVDAGDEDLVTLFAEAQAAKAFVNEAAARIVDRALAASGGAGYLNGHPLARAYRDVRAGSFMHPLGANRAYDFLGDVALGREVVLH